MLVTDFDYSLPEDLIAQHPPTVRGTSRMMTLDRSSGAFADRAFADLPSVLRPGDLLVLNDSRVLPARLFATRGGLTTQHNSPAPTGHIEVLLTEHLPNSGAPGQLAGWGGNPASHNDWLALVKPAKKIQPGETLYFHATPIEVSSRPESAHFADGVERPAVVEPLLPGAPGPNFRTREEPSPLLTATVLAAGDHGERTLRFAPVPDFHAILERIGHLPLPPYIHRDKQQPNTPEDRTRYQTVYSKPLTNDLSSRPEAQRAAAEGPASGITSGSAAAPTAGLHFTPEILAQLAANKIETAYLTLHVGLGTFQPVRVDRTEDIRLHAEPYTISPATAEAINRARSESRRIIAVGTTSTRTLEHIARESERTGTPITAHSGSTGLFLSPGLDDEFKLVSGLLTNFHLPQSTLLMLVSAFAGREAVLRAYAHAVAARYRFFSYGDCMLIT